MAIFFHPPAGTLLMCDFNTGFKPPEMVKKRPVVIVSHKHKNVATVVPLSCTEPIPFESHHWEMSPMSLPASLRGDRCWAKCDMVSCVGFARLDRIMDGKCPNTGRRVYVAPEILPIDFQEIMKSLKYVLRIT
jgi:mRNA interferase MazF